MMEYEKAKHWFTMSWASRAGNIKAVHLSLQHTLYFKRTNGSQKSVSSEVLHCRAKWYLCFICLPFSQWCIAHGAVANRRKPKPGETLWEEKVQGENIHYSPKPNPGMSLGPATSERPHGVRMDYSILHSRVKLRHSRSWFLCRSFYCPK